MCVCSCVQLGNTFLMIPLSLDIWDVSVSQVLFHLDAKPGTYLKIVAQWWSLCWKNRIPNLAWMFTIWEDQ